VEAYSAAGFRSTADLRIERIHATAGHIMRTETRKQPLPHPAHAERFDRKRQYALGKLSGKSNLDYNLEKIGIELSRTRRRRARPRRGARGQERIHNDEDCRTSSPMCLTPRRRTVAIRSVRDHHEHGLETDGHDQTGRPRPGYRRRERIRIRVRRGDADTTPS